MVGNEAKQDVDKGFAWVILAGSLRNICCINSERPDGVAFYIRRQRRRKRDREGQWGGGGP